MVALLFFLLRLLLSPFRRISRLEAENAALRRQLMVPQPGCAVGFSSLACSSSFAYDHRVHFASVAAWPKLPRPSSTLLISS